MGGGAVREGGSEWGVGLESFSMLCWVQWNSSEWPTVI